MTDIDHDDAFRALPQPHLPHRDSGSINQPVVLYAGPMESEHGNLVHRGEGILQFRWLPSPSLRFQIEAAGVDVLSREPIIVRVPSLDFEAEGLWTQAWDNSASGVLNGSPRAGTEIDCEEIQFQLANFHSINGAPVQISRPGSVGARSGRLNLHHRDWEIEVDEVYGYDSRIRELKSEGGFAVSHAGVIRKSGGRLISVVEADDLLEALHTFFSFARGGWCTPLFPRGMREGKVVWEKYASWKISPWKDVGSWFPVRNRSVGRNRNVDFVH